MSGFISKAACRGRRPSQFASYNGFQREGLIGRLLKERGVARFIVAPSGYGKTYLAIDYAETVFSWVHAFFVNCQSPCFIRDLDDDSLADACLKQDSSARLVVFDAVPPVDSSRAERFSREIDKLLSAGCEVIVTCTPAADGYGLLQADRIRVRAVDLLLSDDELDASRPLEERMRTPSSLVGASRRVPALAWDSGSEASVSFVKRCLQEPMPADLLLAMSTMYVLRRGPLDSLTGVGPIDLDLVGQLMKEYPHFDYDEELAEFVAPDLPAEIVAQAMKSSMGVLVETSSLASSADLVCAWGDLLLEKLADAGRACDTVRMLCPRSRRGRWVARHAVELVRRGCFYPALKLIRMASTKSSDIPKRERRAMALLEMTCLIELGDNAAAVVCAKRYAYDEDEPLGARIACLLAIVRAGTGVQASTAAAALERTVSALSARELDDLEPEGALALAWQAAREDVAELARLWVRLRACGAQREVLCVVAERLFAHVGSSPAPDVAASPAFKHDVGEAERFVRDELEARGLAPADCFAVSAALAMERAHVAGMAYAAGPLATATLIGLRNAELALVRQRQLFAQDAEVTKAKRTSWADVRPDAPDALQSPQVVLSPQRNVPILELKTFGRFEVAVGGVPLEAKALGRKNVRSLLVLLAINQGRELSRATAMRSIWPKSSEDVARKNFYSIWSQLKKSLTLPDGTCPYLIRHQYGCALEERYVHSDIARLGQICRELLFGRPDVQEWAEIYAEIDRDFLGDFMAAEADIPLVANARAEYCSQLVDALVAATQSIVEVGNPQWGIWFARMAIARDEVREDAYVALMRAQIAADQRTAAIMTFLKCQRILADRLGVDPSPETMALYESLLD